MAESAKKSSEAAKSGKGLGCAAMVLIGLIAIVSIMMGGNFVAGRYFECEGVSEGEDLFNCLMNLSDKMEAAPEGSVTATGTYEFKGYSVNVTMHIPLEGGNVTGSVSGACDGSVRGSYGGEDGGGISGKLSGTCDPFFIKIPASAKFSGTVNKTAKIVPISFTGSGGGLTHSGSMSLSY